MQRHILLYDADCGPCTWFKRIIDFIDAHGEVEFRALVQGDSEGMLRPLPRSLRYASFHLVSPTGRLTSGANALPTLIALLPSGGLASMLIMKAPGGREALDFVYRTLSRLHDSGACQNRRGRQGRLVQDPLRHSDDKLLREPGLQR